MKKTNVIKVGMSTCGLGAGAQEIYDYLQTEIQQRKLNIQVKQVGCLGMCYAEPLVEVNVAGTPHVLYGKVDIDIAKKIVNTHIRDKRLIHDHIYYFSLEEDK